jgi:glycoprotein 2-beta-D-xylosyltransferase
MTDLYTVYLLCRFFQQEPKSVRILFIDAHPKGNLDLLWSQLFHSYTRLGHLKNVSSILYRKLIWSQPQPRSEIDIQQNRRVAPSYFFDFRDHILKQFNINYQADPKMSCQSLKIFFLVRHNYVAHPRNPTGKIGRQLLNEKEILDDLKMKFSQYPNVNFSWNHFEELSFVEQLKIIVETDIFVGVHGAGLTHVLFLKSNRALIELAGFTQIGDHFDLLASMNKINYHRCMISDGSPSATQTIYDCITKKLSEMCPSTTTSTMSTLSTEKTTVFAGNTSISIIKN